MYVRPSDFATPLYDGEGRAAWMPATVMPRAAVKIPPLIAFFSFLLLSLLSLLAAYWLSLEERAGATQFLMASIFLAVLCAVIGTNGKISLQAVTKAIHAMRHG